MCEMRAKSETVRKPEHSIIGQSQDFNTTPIAFSCQA
jgi:hypothetical protein